MLEYSNKKAKKPQVEMHFPFFTQVSFNDNLIKKYCFVSFKRHIFIREIKGLKAKDQYAGKFVITDDSVTNNVRNKASKAKRSKNSSSGNGNKPVKAKKTAGRILAVLALILVILGIIGIIMSWKAVYDAKQLKTSVKQTVICLKNGDADSADASIAKAEASISALRSDLDEKKWKAAEAIPFLGPLIADDLDTARKTVDIADRATENILKPASFYIRETGMISLDSFSLKEMGPDMAVQLHGICDIIDTVGPDAEIVVREINELPKFNFFIIENEVSEYRDIIDKAGFLVPLLESASTNVIRPAADTMNNYPFADLKTEDGMDANVIVAYLDLEDKIEPHIMDICDQILSSSLINDEPEKYHELSTKLIDVMKTMYEINTYKPLIRFIVGNGEDRTFIVIAQNCAEMRACGGFPGSVGAATVRDGEFKFGDFQSIYNVMPFYQASSITITEEENTIFLEDWYGELPIRATCNPHFPRCAEVFSAAYEQYNKTEVDGVISLTPHIIQRLLRITGPVTLSNGYTIDSENAVGYLQRQIYIDYFTTNKTANSNDITDSLFAETAETVYKKLFENLNKESLSELLSIITESGKDRVFMMWMKDPESEEVLMDLGLSGALNSDPTSPQLAVFYSVNDANKLGPYFDYSVTMGEGIKNEDGTVSYPVTVVISNNIDELTMAIGKGNAYILAADYGASMNSLIYFFAPAGGTVSNFSNDANLRVTIEEYNGLHLGFCKDFLLDPGETILFSYTVTTAEGVTIKPEIMTQPLIYEYCV